MNIVDNIVSFFSPEAGARRARSRALENVYKEAARKFDAAGHGKRNSNWRAGSTSANTEVAESATTLRNRARDLARNNTYVYQAFERIANNVVGSGIKPSIVGGSRANRAAKQAWREWADTKICDHDGRTNMAGLQRLVMRAVAESGEVFVRRRWLTTGAVPLQLQVLEADFLDAAKDGISTEGGGYIMQGIEFDANSKRVAYWLYDYHPGENRLYKSMTSRRVPADEITHIYHALRPGQIRGIPFGVSAFMRAKDFDEYEDAQLIRQKIAACFTAFVETPNDPLPGEKVGDGLPLERVEPGMIEYLPPGKRVTFGTPPPTDKYDEYSRRTLQGMSAGFGITYEALTNDLSNVNFSSGRMGWIEMGRQITVWQEQMMVPQFCDTVFAWFVQAAQIAGTLRGNVTATWTPPARMMIDPVKETKGLSDQVRNGFISWQEAVRQQGYDPDEVAAELDADYKAFEQFGFMLSCDPRHDPTRRPPDTGNSPPPA